MGKNNFAENYNIDERYSRKLIKGTVGATMGVNSPNALIKRYGKWANRIELLRLLEKESKFKIIWYAFFLCFALVFTIIFPESYLSVIDLVVLMVNIDLCSRGKVLGVYIGILECFIYAFISYTTGLLGEMFKVLAICVPINIYTIISWTINMKKLKAQNENKYANQQDADIEVKKLSPRGWMVTILSSIVAVAASYVLLKFVLGQTVSLILNSITLALMLIFKILSGARYMESWIFSIVMDILSLALWISVILSGAGSVLEIPVLAITLAALSNDIYAFIMWKALYRRVAVNGGILLNRRPVSIKRIITLRRKFKEMKWNRKVEENHLKAINK